MPEWAKRFRSEAGLACIDTHVRHVSQLFDHRDPSPFNERDLDDDAADYLVASVEELPPRQPFKVVVWIAEPFPDGLPSDAVATSIERHFTAARDNLRRRHQKHQRRARWMMLFSFVMLVVLLSLAEITTELNLTHIQLIPQSLTIIAWVIMWRPIDLLIFDWFPYLVERRQLDRIRAAPIEVRVGRPSRDFGPTGHAML